MSEFPPRRHPVAIVRVRAALLRAGFVQHLWPAPDGNHWILTWTSGWHRITVVLGPHRGHPVVIPSTWNGQRWHALNAEPPRDNVAAARKALSLVHQIHRDRQAAA
jgi:hypothetical protein